MDDTQEQPEIDCQKNDQGQGENRVCQVIKPVHVFLRDCPVKPDPIGQERDDHTPQRNYQQADATRKEIDSSIESVAEYIVDAECSPDPSAIDDPQGIEFPGDKLEEAVTGVVAQLRARQLCQQDQGREKTEQADQ